MSINLKVISIVVLSVCICIFCGCDRQKHADIKKAKIGDIELAYYTRGSGEPLVMIMGFRGTMALWDPALLDLLEKKYTLILFDNRGVGLSSDTEENLTTIPQMAEDTANLIKALGFQKAHVLGWSMGSRIALELALNYPERVENLILCSPNPGGKFQARRKTQAYAKLTSPHVSDEEGLSLIFPDSPEGHKAKRAFVERMTDAIIGGSVPDDLKISHKTVERQAHALKLWDEDNHIYDELPTIKRPTLVVGGGADVLDQPENVRLIANRIPFSWSVYFPGAGHNFLSQDYKHFADLINLFIESTKQEVAE